MTLQLLPVTFTAVSLYAIALVIFAGWIGIYRGSVNILRGDGGDAVLFKRSRIHGNLIENAPSFLIILGIAEYMGLGSTWLWLAVLSFLIGRVGHYWLYDQKARALPMSLSNFPGAIMGIWVLLHIWGG